MPILSLDYPMVLGFITGLLVALVAIPPIVRVSIAKKLVAVPNGRTSHNGHIPALGGVAIFASVILGTTLFITNDNNAEFRYIIAGLVIIFFTGLKDDLVNLGWLKKLASEIIAALLVVVLADVRITTFHGMIGIDTLSYGVSVAFSLFVFIALINCFNLLDGIDGLASGMGIFISFIFGLWLNWLGYDNFAVLSFSLAGALACFYAFNVFGRKYKLFMGDSGSLLLGFLFAVLAIKILCCEMAPGDPHYMKAFPSVVMGVMILPIMDTLRVFTVRILSGKSPFHADRTHLHHIFLELGFNHFQASTILILMNAVLFGITVLIRNWNGFVVAAILFSLALFASLVPQYFAQRKSGKQETKILQHTYRA
jgi:UDP-N-acetylmuramyl pentapeptide phosphotransferase/UDP-N-acetylglucosamine-1-phosphate transferase